MEIAILDADRLRAERVLRALSAAGYTASVFRNADRFLELANTRVFDILLLEVGAVQKGMAFLIEAARSKGVRKILLLAETRQAQGVHEALLAGVDDYLCFPLRQKELQMRISVLAKTLFPDAAAHEHLRYGDFVFARYPNSLRVAEKTVVLTAREFELALFLFRHIGMPLSRAHMAEAVWKMDGNDMARTIDTHVSRVRRKLNLKAENGFVLEQIYGFGYQLLSLPKK